MAARGDNVLMANSGGLNFCSESKVAAAAAASVGLEEPEHVITREEEEEEENKIKNRVNIRGTLYQEARLRKSHTCTFSAEAHEGAAGLAHLCWTSLKASVPSHFDRLVASELLLPVSPPLVQRLTCELTLQRAVSGFISPDVSCALCTTRVNLFAFDSMGLYQNRLHRGEVHNSSSEVLCSTRAAPAPTSGEPTRSPGAPEWDPSPPRRRAAITLHLAAREEQGRCAGEEARPEGGITHTASSQIFREAEEIWLTADKPHCHLALTAISPGVLVGSPAKLHVSPRLC
ncbi:unnamed protein product [Pleuronectes platessa]|uniref:Uncharacterized protein n=1 Tax=Pleuronectes platessa TaxID=8262 RepID=A0A9N7U622_PLEPL|nr:unnamed protein product [Pleuronectes platessa]